jgi:hypothetical protein
MLRTQKSKNGTPFRRRHLQHASANVYGRLSRHARLALFGMVLTNAVLNGRMENGAQPIMIRTIAFLLLGAALALPQDHQALVNEHGDDVVGFSHDKTTHHFELTYDGGVIDVRANDVRDTESRDQIRSHFRHISQMFVQGNFNVPMLVHGTSVPGTATMTRLKDQLHWQLLETPRGARQDYQTGDCPMVHGMVEN